MKNIPDKEILAENEIRRMGATLLHNLFSQLKLPRIFTTLPETEIDYIKYLEQFGFKIEGKLREQVFYQGKYHNLVTLGLLKRELKKVR